MSIIIKWIGCHQGFLIGYLLGMGLLELIFCAGDKYQAKAGGWRIRENLLLGLGVFGGALGLWLGMTLFHHKISKAKFRFTVPFLAMAQWGFVLYCGGSLCLQSL